MSGSFEKEGGSIQVMAGMGVVYLEDSMVNQRRRKERRGNAGRSGEN